jgi:hypothetical protein
MLRDDLADSGRRPEVPLLDADTASVETKLFVTE